MVNYKKQKNYSKTPPLRAGGRRLQPAAVAVAAGVGTVKTLRAANAYRNRKNKAIAKQNVALLNNRLQMSDNIVTASPIYIGKPKQLSFQEKVARVANPPMLFKRNYAWNAECESGRKAWFHIDFNVMNTSDLSTDMNTYKLSLTTNTATADPVVTGAFASDGAQFYVDSLRETIKMVNSSSNSIKGKCHLIAYKRDSDNNYGGSGCPIAPPNLMAYFSTNGGLTQLTAGAGAESTVGNGWAFNTATAGSRFDSPLNMPGSSLHPTAVCLQTDPQLGLFSPHIKDRMTFYFKNIASSEWSLKPGQQFDQKIIMNDLKTIHREQQEFIHIAGITYALVVEFTAGIVGDSGAGAGVGLVTTGSAQLSCIRESTRTLGLKNPLRSQIILQTAPLSIIPLAVQTTINPDSGTLLTGAQYDP